MRHIESSSHPKKSRNASACSNCFDGLLWVFPVRRQRLGFLHTNVLLQPPHPFYYLMILFIIIFPPSPPLLLTKRSATMNCDTPPSRSALQGMGLCMAASNISCIWYFIVTHSGTAYIYHSPSFHPSHNPFPPSLPLTSSPFTANHHHHPVHTRLPTAALTGLQVHFSDQCSWRVRLQH